MFRVRLTCLRLFEIAERELGPISALVNNAAITGGFARVEDIGSAALAQMLAVNVAGTILCAREAVRQDVDRRGGSGGAIVNISSIAARTGSAGEWVHYAASKGAVNTFHHRTGARSGHRGDSRERRRSGFGGNGAARGEWRTGTDRAAESYDTDATGRNSGRDRAGRAVAAFGRSFLYDGDDSRNRRRALSASRS